MSWYGSIGGSCGTKHPLHRPPKHNVRSGASRSSTSFSSSSLDPPKRNVRSGASWCHTGFSYVLTLINGYVVVHGVAQEMWKRVCMLCSGIKSVAMPGATVNNGGLFSAEATHDDEHDKGSEERQIMHRYGRTGRGKAIRGRIGKFGNIVMTAALFSCALANSAKVHPRPMPKINVKEQVGTIGE